jgi:uncharacterized surface protein with fasciclin (FAS1) repeats
MNALRTVLPVALILVLGSLVLAGCDSSPQGDTFGKEQLSVDGPTRAVLPNFDSTAVVPADENPGIRMDVDTARYVNEDYEMGREFTWTVTGEPGASALGTREGGASFVVDPPDAPGTYSVTVSTAVSADSVTGSFATKVDYPSATTQVEKRGQRVLPALLREAGLADALDSDDPNDAVGSYTALFPSDDALRDVFDENRNGVITDNEIPPERILSKILRYHILPDSVRLSDAEPGQTQTAFPGHAVDLNPGLTQLAVDAAESEATTIETDVATSDGVVHRVDETLLPSGAISFQDQTSAGSSQGDTIRVDGAYAPRGGFVVLYDTQALENANSDPATADAILGTSFLLDRGFNDRITIITDDPLNVPAGQSLSVTAILHYDRDDDRVFDEPDELRPDPRYLRNGDFEPVAEQADVEAGS